MKTITKITRDGEEVKIDNDVVDGLKDKLNLLNKTHQFLLEIIEESIKDIEEYEAYQAQQAQQNIDTQSDS